jgi:SAM-dependent methyltransferase
MPGNKIEIPSVEMLDRHRKVVNDFWKVSSATRVEPGWHYLLDLTWIVENLGPVTGKRFLDAGAGMGLMQWYLMEQGAAEVISADRTSRSNLPLIMRSRYNVHGMRPDDLKPAWEVFKGNLGHASGAGKVVTAVRGLAGLILTALPKRFTGTVRIYNHDLADLPEIPDDSLDAVVAVSSLEHNSPEGLKKVVPEIMRTLKPGGKLLATLCAGRDRDWFHAASQGWCYTAATLRNLFELPADVSSNYERYDEFMAGLRDCSELRSKLAKFYFQSGDNGMPWGKWDPQYQPVGVCKVKQ